MHCINIMSTLDVHIFGVRERKHMLEATAVKLGIDKAHIHYDDRPNGGSVMYTAKKAWLADIPNEITRQYRISKFFLNYIVLRKPAVCKV